MHYLAHSITKLCQGREQYMILEKKVFSVCVPESERVWTAYGLVWVNRRLGLRQGHRCPCTTLQGDSRCISDLCNSCVWEQRRTASSRQRVGIDNYIFAWSLNLKQTLENANNQVGKHNSLKTFAAITDSSHFYRSLPSTTSRLAGNRF